MGNDVGAEDVLSLTGVGFRISVANRVTVLKNSMLGLTPIRAPITPSVTPLKQLQKGFGIRCARVYYSYITGTINKRGRYIDSPKRKGPSLRFEGAAHERRRGNEVS